MAQTNDVQKQLRDAYTRRKFGQRDIGLLDGMTQQWFAKQAQDPWSAIGAMLGYGYGSYLGDKERANQLEDAKAEEEALAREAQYAAAQDAANASGLVGMDSADAIRQQKENYMNYQNQANEIQTKMNAIEDKSSDEYKNLARSLYQLQGQMNDAHNTADNLRTLRTQMGLSNDGLYANNSGAGYLREKLGDVSMLNPIQQPQQGGQNTFGATLPIPQINPNGQVPTSAVENPTITQMAQNTLGNLSRQNTPSGIITQDALTNFMIANPDLKKKIVSDTDNQKRSASYWKDLRQKLRAKGLSDSVIDEYIDTQAQDVVDDLVGNYYKAIGEGNYLGADAIGTLLTNLDPTMAQVLKTGGVSVGNLFGAEQQEKSMLFKVAQALAKEQRADAHSEQKRINDIMDFETKERIKDRIKNASGNGNGSKKEEKLPEWQQTMDNYLTQGEAYLNGGNLNAAWDAVVAAKNYLLHDEKAKAKIPGEAIPDYYKLVAMKEAEIIKAMMDAGIYEGSYEYAQSVFHDAYGG